MDEQLWNKSGNTKKGKLQILGWIVQSLKQCDMFSQSNVLYSLKIKLAKIYDLRFS